MGTAFSYFASNPQADWKAGVDSVERYKELARQDGLNLRSGDYELIQHVLHFLSDPAYPQLKSNFKTSGLEASLKPIADLVKTSPKPNFEPKKPTSSAAPDYKSIASLAPKWRWTHDQCVSWIKASLVYYGGYPELEATAFAAQFHGFGPGLILMTYEEWYGWLHQDGACIRAILLETKHSEGGMPKCLYLPDKGSKEAKKEAKDEAGTRGREMRKNAFEMMGWKEENHRPRLKEPSQSNSKDSTRKGGNANECESHGHKREKEIQSDLKHSTKESQRENESKGEGHEQKNETTTGESNYNKNKKMWDAYDPESPKIAFRMLAQEYRKNPKQGIKKQVPDSNSKDPNASNDSKDKNEPKDSKNSEDPKDMVGSKDSNNSQDLEDLSDDSKDSDWEGNWEVEG